MEYSRSKLRTALTVTVLLATELRHRLEREGACHGGGMPERTALVWHGYLAACLDQGLLEVHQYLALKELVPDVADNPVEFVFLGRE